MPRLIKVTNFTKKEPARVDEYELNTEEIGKLIDEYFNAYIDDPKFESTFEVKVKIKQWTKDQELD